MSSRLVLVRHGQTDWNAAGRIQGRTDIPLNAHGRAQATTTAENLRDGQWEILVSSPLLRAVETADLIGQQLGLPRGPDVPALIERDYGSAEGKPASVFSEGELDAHGGAAEPKEEVARRGTHALQQLLDLYPGKAIIAVTHGTLIRLMLTEILGRTHSRIQNGQAIEVSTGLLDKLKRPSVVH